MWAWSVFRTRESPRCSRRLTRATPKIAAYPFTTLSPNLGVARLEDRELVIADIPGLIEGAHTGAGLGEEFLRHIERTRLIVHVVDLALEDPIADIAVVDTELAAYGQGLMERRRLFALNKLDLFEARQRAPATRTPRSRRDRGLGAHGRARARSAEADLRCLRAARDRRGPGSGRAADRVRRRRT